MEGKKEKLLSVKYSDGPSYSYLQIQKEITKDLDSGKYHYHELLNDTGDYRETNEQYSSFSDAFKNFYEDELIYFYAFVIEFIKKDLIFIYTEKLMVSLNSCGCVELSKELKKSVKKHLKINLKLVKKVRKKGLKTIRLSDGKQKMFFVGKVNLTDRIITVLDEKNDVVYLTGLTNNLSIQTEEIVQDNFWYFNPI